MNDETNSEAPAKRPAPRVLPDAHAFEIVDQVGRVIARGVAVKGVAVERIDKGLYAHLLSVQPA